VWASGLAAWVLITELFAAPYGVMYQFLVIPSQSKPASMEAMPEFCVVSSQPETVSSKGSRRV
jgi:hypothetical protein